MCNELMKEIDVGDGVCVDFHLCQTARHAWEITLPREADSIKIIIDQHGIALYREQNETELTITPHAVRPTHSYGEFLERWVLV